MDCSSIKTRFMMQHPRAKDAENILDLAEDDAEQPQSSQVNLFSSFLYRDHVTRFRCEISKLKNGKRTKTCPNQNYNSYSSQLTFFNEELKLLQAIKETRNKELIQNFKSKSMLKAGQRIKISALNQQEEVDKVKRKIRRQVLNLNHQFLREYLYHQQPFNKMLIQINKYSNAGIIDEYRINELKEKIIKCMDQRKNENWHLSKQGFEQKKQKKYSLNRTTKKMKERQVQKKFQQIWNDFKKQIISKVRMEGEFNLYGSKLK